MLGREVNLLASLPRQKRAISIRKASKSDKVVQEAKKFGELYWDGPREYGYGGYRYDGRWRSVARDIISHFNLKSGMRILDVGCGKGFLVNDLMLELPGLQAFGVDISEYALKNCLPAVIGRLHNASADVLCFPDKSFECVISINTLHNLKRNRLLTALKEIERLSIGKSYIQVDSYHNKEQKQLFESWVLTAEFHDYPSGWIKLFEEAGYTGDYNWTIVD